MTNHNADYYGNKALQRESEEAKREFTKTEKQLIEVLAKKSELIKNFADVKVFSEADKGIVCVNMEDRNLYLNMASKDMPFKSLLKHIEAIITHENGHLDERLLVPSNLEMGQIYTEYCKKNEIPHELLNLVCDMEIHQQYLTQKKIKPIQRLKLMKFLTEIRNMVFEQDKTNIAIAMTYPITEEQKKVKEIIESRNIDIREKIKRVNDLLKKNPQNQKKEITCITGLIIPDRQKKDGEGKGKGKQKNKGKQKGKKEKSPLPQKSKSIKNEVTQKGQDATIRQDLASMGFSDAEIEELLQREDRGELLTKVENLKDSLKNMLPTLEESYSREKTKEKLDSRGHRFNGYHKMRDIREVTENVEDLVTVGQYDLNEIHVPTNVDRKRVGMLIVLRDVSGSIGQGKLAKKVRDVTVGLIEMAQKNGHRIGVIDFHSDVEPIKDAHGKVLTREYRKLLLDSMLFKFGYSTRLDKALNYINRVVEEEKLIDVPLNVFIITDGQVDNVDIKLISKKVKVTGLLCREYYNDEKDNTEPTKLEYVNSSFTSVIARFKGKLYEITADREKLFTHLLKDYSAE
jgi:Mg-chelatase subunit ChlD